MEKTTEQNYPVAIVGHGRAEIVSERNCFRPKEHAVITFGRALPHWQQGDKLVFVTFRLGDSLPHSKFAELRERLENPESGEIDERYADVYRAKVNELLDNGCGCCLLGIEGVAQIVENVLLDYASVSYDLYDYVIMPNHVHFIMRPFDELSVIMKKIKGVTARKINVFLQREGRVWLKESFDHLIRSLEDFERFSDYIQHNPDALPIESCVIYRF